MNKYRAEIISKEVQDMFDMLKASMELHQEFAVWHNKQGTQIPHDLYKKWEKLAHNWEGFGE